ncbi:uncharacterized protein BXZ73DRAFT_100921 [Epithele typhae]|uniref:uncharacterized protein n=1 Tax=Epithele typhae TaxID=378194 RepID=UPI002008845A|nr:uncharacterized protein BXZ73DRAFT_100921 [Epithele typhae]KAH9934083.1 hypothetical protein BXZ73DRAFT_100921 [Epithele typhae]
MAERLIRVKWGSRAVGFRRDDVESVIAKAKKHFKLPPQESYALSGNINGVQMELSDDIMSLLPPGEVVLLEKLECESDGPPLNGETFTIRNVSSVDDVKTRLQEKEGLSSDIRLMYFGNRLAEGHPLSFYGIEKDSTLDLVPNLLGGKPVIYLLPPNPLPVVDVSVLLVPQWRFSHIYPLANIKPIADSGKECVAWSVSAHPDGTLVELSSGLELSYLFWEAESRHVPSSPPPSPRLAAIEHFDPAAPTLDPTSPTAVCLPFAALLPYLDNALKRLTLHVAARNDFITYWLPKLSKAPFVALRFLPQAAYARAAELRVEPAPDVVTRVFMLFRGVSEAEAEAGEWAAARARAVDGGVDWAEVVGVRPEATDAGVFRVLEWGAMEVL